MTDDDYLTDAEVAARFRVAKATLRTWRRRNYGPKWVRFGRRVVYKRAEVKRYEEQQERETARGGAA
ncbi:MAG TPA: helix-turn-helix domain-containing protein [Acidimicrobiales bacterium]|nr:helix-turn-helix domain-containing protein [Acidimicrobiales bacterium]